jgi:hypothetical protein
MPPSALTDRIGAAVGEVEDPTKYGGAAVGAIVGVGGGGEGSAGVDVGIVPGELPLLPPPPPFEFVGEVEDQRNACGAAVREDFVGEGVGSEGGGGGVDVGVVPGEPPFPPPLNFGNEEKDATNRNSQGSIDSTNRDSLGSIDSLLNLFRDDIENAEGAGSFVMSDSEMQCLLDFDDEVSGGEDGNGFEASGGDHQQHQSYDFRSSFKKSRTRRVRKHHLHSRATAETKIEPVGAKPAGTATADQRPRKYQYKLGLRTMSRSQGRKQTAPPPRRGKAHKGWRHNMRRLLTKQRRRLSKASPCHRGGSGGGNDDDDENRSQTSRGQSVPSCGHFELEVVMDRVRELENEVLMQRKHMLTHEIATTSVLEAALVPAHHHVAVVPPPQNPDFVPPGEGGTPHAHAYADGYQEPAAPDFNDESGGPPEYARARLLQVEVVGPVEVVVDRGDLRSGSSGATTTAARSPFWKDKKRRTGTVALGAAALLGVGMVTQGGEGGRGASMNIQVHDQNALSSSSLPGEDGLPFLAASRKECGLQSFPLGYYVSPEACNRAATAAFLGPDAVPCPQFMFSRNVPSWGCRCCFDESIEHHTYHSDWNIYNTVSMSSLAAAEAEETGAGGAISTVGDAAVDGAPAIARWVRWWDDTTHTCYGDMTSDNYIASVHSKSQAMDTVSECKAACERDQHCNAFFYIPLTDRCLLYSECDGTPRTTSQHGRTYIKASYLESPQRYVHVSVEADNGNYAFPCAEGNGGNNCVATTATAQEVHPVRCCHISIGGPTDLVDIGGNAHIEEATTVDWSNEFCEDVWQTTSPLCLELNHDDAVVHCASIGGRLCTLDEVERQCVRGTGCGFDYRMIWVDTQKTLQASMATRTPTADDNIFQHDCVDNPDFVDLYGNTCAEWVFYYCEGMEEDYGAVTQNCPFSCGTCALLEYLPVDANHTDVAAQNKTWRRQRNTRHHYV